MRADDLISLLVGAGAASPQGLDAVAAAGDDDDRLARLLALAGEQEHLLAEHLAERHQRPCLLIGTSTLDLTVLAGLSPEVLVEEQVLPVARRDESLTVAVASPEAATRALQDLGVQTGHHIVAVVAVPALLAACIAQALADHAAGNARLRGPHSASADVDLVFARPPTPVLEDANEIARALGEVLGEPAPPRGAALGVLRLKQVRVPSAPAIPTVGRPPPSEDGAVLDLMEVHDDAIDTGLLKRIDDLDDDGDDGAADVSALEPLADDLVAVAGGDTDEAPAPARRPFALVVEDDDAIGALLCRTLEKDGCDTTHLLSGDGVADVLRARRPDVILLDAMLPGVHGFEICAALKHSRDWRDVPVAMVSAVYRSFDQVKEIHEHHGADAFIAKPFKIEHVRRVVADLLRRPAPVEAPQASKALSASRAQALVDHHLLLGDVEAATGIVERWVSAEPLSARAWLERGHLAVAAGDHFRALQAYELAALYDRRLFIAQMALARHCQDLGFARKARGAWMAAAACAPDPGTADRIRRTLG